MRLFVALELPGPLTEALADNIAALRACVPGRFVAPDSLHATLAFLGEVSGALVGQVSGVLESACAGASPFEASLGELGSFGRRDTATLWQGLDAGAGELDGLAGRVRDGLRDAGFALDGKSFVPHVTLMRKADLTGGVLPMMSTATGVVDTVTLFESDLSGERPIYTPLHSVDLRI